MTQLMEGAGNAIGILLEDAKKLCIDSSESISFEKKMGIWTNKSSQIHLIFSGLMSFVQDSRKKEEIRKITFSQTINTFSDIIFPDFIVFKKNVEHVSDRLDLEFYLEDIMVIQDEFIYTREVFEIPKDYLTDTKLPHEISTVAWGLHNDLPKLIDFTKSRIHFAGSREITKKSPFKIFLFINSTFEITYSGGYPCITTQDKDVLIYISEELIPLLEKDRLSFINDLKCFPENYNNCLGSDDRWWLIKNQN